MKRLTTDDYDYCLNECKKNKYCTYHEGHGLTCPDIEKYKKLAKYEYTGLEPDVCMNYKIFEDELIAKNVTFKHILELLKAEEQGLLIKLPCKAGDMVYEANILRNIISVYKVTSVIIMTGSRNYAWELQDGIYSNLNGFNEYAIGRSVFLTREAADQVMKGENIDV